MTGFEPRTYGIGSDRSTNWATTTALSLPLIDEMNWEQQSEGQKDEKNGRSRFHFEAICFLKINSLKKKKKTCILAPILLKYRDF